VTIISVVAVTSMGGTNNERGVCGGREAEAAMAARGGNGRRQQDRAEVGIGILLDFYRWAAEEMICSSIQMT
jgi:hypothetical protein